MGDNGVIEKARKASNETIKAQLQEELQLKIIDLQIEKEKTGEKITNSDIEGALGVLEGIEVDSTGKNVEGEYKDYGYKVDDNYNVIITNRLSGEKPIGYAEVITKNDNIENVQIQVVGELVDGEIESIEALDGAELLEKKNSGEYIFVVNDNKTYTFRIRGNNGRSLTISCLVDNAIPTRDDLLSAVSKIYNSGEKKVRVIGKTNPDSPDEEIIYSLNVIRYVGTMVLDGQTNFDGMSLSGTTYSLGKVGDISSNGKTYAKNTIVLKVEGDLIINSGITLTTIKSGYSGPKGLIVYCSGTFTNNGIVQMDNAGAYAKGENVYLLKNSDVDYMFIPQIGRNWRRWSIYH